MDAEEALVQLEQEIRNAKKKVKMTGTQAFHYLILQARHNYRDYSVSEAEVEVLGERHILEFHRVGRNSTHSFYVALFSGMLVVRSYCLNSILDVEEYGAEEVEENIRICGTANEVDFPTYLGHY